MGKLSFLKAIPFFSLANLAKLDLHPFVTLKDFGHHYSDVPVAQW